MPDPRIAALDLSLDSTGAARWDPSEWREPLVERIRPGFRMPSPVTQEARMRRLDGLHHQISGFIGGVDLVLIEGYSYGSKNGGERLGELGGIIRLSLYTAGIPFLEVAPPQLKKYALGKGVGSKDAILSAAVHRAGREFTNDTADAWWLLQMALCHYGLPHVPMPAVNRAVLDKIDWPIVRVPEPTP